VLIVGVDEALHVAQMLLELLGEFQVLLVTPRAAERMQLGRERRGPVGQVLIELLEHLCEQPQFVGIDNGLSHDDFRFLIFDFGFDESAADDGTQSIEQAVDFTPSFLIQAEGDRAADERVAEQTLFLKQVFLDGQESVQSRLQRDEC